VTTNGELLEQDLRLATETPFDLPHALVVYVKLKASLAWPTVLLKIAPKVLGKPLLPALPAGTEPLTHSSLLSKSNGVLSMLNPCSEVQPATALGLLVHQNANSLLTATLPSAQLIAL
jgi:hypothetical protein